MREAMMLIAANPEKTIITENPALAQPSMMKSEKHVVIPLTKVTKLPPISLTCVGYISNKYTSKKLYCNVITKLMMINAANDPKCSLRGCGISSFFGCHKKMSIIDKISTIEKQRIAMTFLFIF